MLKKRNRRDKEIMIRSKRSISVLIIILALVFNTNFEVLVYADNGLNYLENNNMLINNKIINIPDKALKAAINRELGQSKDSNITKSQLESLTGIYAPNYNINDITGIEYCINLRALDLKDNNISDISALSNLNKLNNLELNNNNISDISPLKGKVIEHLNAENQLIELEKVVLDSNSLKVKNLIKGEDGNLLSPSFISNDGYYDGVNDIVWNNLNNQQEVYYEFNYDKIIDEEYGEFKYSGKVVQPIEYKNVNNPDVNGDGAVDINDIAMIALRYNKTSDDILWDENLDINKDRIIDLYDLTIVAREL